MSADLWYPMFKNRREVKISIEVLLIKVKTESEHEKGDLLNQFIGILFVVWWNLIVII